MNHNQASLVAQFFWTEGDTVRVCQAKPCMVEVFAGLFLHSGSGRGDYYSGVTNEMVSMHWTDARALALAENIPFVQFYSSDYTSDPKLTEQRKQAQQIFDCQATLAKAPAEAF